MESPWANFHTAMLSAQRSRGRWWTEPLDQLLCEQVRVVAGAWCLACIARVIAESRASSQQAAISADCAIVCAMSCALADAVMSDDDLWGAFHDRTLTHGQWTHTAHLRIASLHLARYELDEAHLRMRVGIIRLNTAHGLVETPQRGYHETLTRVWLMLVREARRRMPAADSATLATAPELGRDA